MLYLLIVSACCVEVGMISTQDISIRIPVIYTLIEIELRVVNVINHNYFRFGVIGKQEN